jgi:hypothetical protein
MRESDNRCNDYHSTAKSLEKPEISREENRAVA